MTIGRMRHRLTLQEQTGTPDGGGGFDLGWSDIADNPQVQAAIVGASGSEQFRFRQLSQAVTHRIRMRYRPDVTAEMRLLGADKVYNIVSVIDTAGTGRFLDILAVESTI